MPDTVHPMTIGELESKGYVKFLSSRPFLPGSPASIRSYKVLKGIWGKRPTTWQANNGNVTIEVYMPYAKGAIVEESGLTTKYYPAL